MSKAPAPSEKEIDGGDDNSSDAGQSSMIRDFDFPGTEIWDNIADIIKILSEVVHRKASNGEKYV